MTTALSSAVEAARTENRSAADRLRLLIPLLRLRWLLLTAWAAVTATGTYSSGNEWTLFAWGGDLLFGSHRPFGFHHLPVPIQANAPTGLHIFANYHVFQMGPLPLLLAAGLNRIGPDQGQMAAVALITVIGLVSLWLLERTSLRVHDRESAVRRVWIPLTTLVGGFIYLQVWSEVSGRWTHLDDALAVLFFSIACWGLARRRPALVALAIGLAVASKPWAIGLAPMVLAFHGRERRQGLLWLAGAVALPWAPFLIADWRTVTAGNLSIFIQPASPLIALGFHAQPFHHASEWRALQFVLELAAAAVAVRWRIWGAALLACLAIRLAIDPMTYGYYQASFAAAAIGFDLLVWRRPKPVATCIAALAWITSIDVSRASQGAPLLVAYLGALALIALVVVRTRRHAQIAPA